MSVAVEVIELQGTFENIKGQKLVAEVQAEIQEGINAVLVDFYQVTFMDSAGLASLVKLVKATHAAGVRFALCSIRPQVMTLLKMTRMDGMFEIFADRAQFLAALQQDLPDGASFIQEDQGTAVVPYRADDLGLSIYKSTS